jgi:hypothetical protein
MTKEQRDDAERVCIMLAGCTFNNLYASGERSRKMIKALVMLEVMGFCRSQGWNNKVINYHWQRFGMTTLKYWFTRYKDTLKR